jgi:hypothetical protein
MSTKELATITVADLAETVSQSMLNAVERRVNVNKFLEANNTVIVNPIIRFGGWIILSKEGALRGIQVGESGVGGG